MNKRKEDSFRLDNSITYYLNDYADDKDKQRKIIQRHNGDLFYIFKQDEREENARTLGKS